MKYPAVYVYKHTKNNGAELRHSLRSLKNLLNHNGEVIIVGDREDWFSDKITHIKAGYKDHSQCCLNRQIKCYYGEFYNWNTATKSKLVPDWFILMNDDFFITRPAKIENMTHKNPLTKKGVGMHRKCWNKTANWLKANDYTYENFEIHTPMIVNKKKLRKVHDLLLEERTPPVLLHRSMYGNMFMNAKTLRKWRDQKTYNNNPLSKDVFISVDHWNDELALLFNEGSIYENDIRL